MDPMWGSDNKGELGTGDRDMPLETLTAISWPKAALNAGSLRPMGKADLLPFTEAAGAGG